MTCNDGDDVAADRRLLDPFNGNPLVDGSNALSIQEECRCCEQELPGLMRMIGDFLEASYGRKGERSSEDTER